MLNTLWIGSNSKLCLTFELHKMWWISWPTEWNDCRLLKVWTPKLTKAVLSKLYILATPQL